MIGDGCLPNVVTYNVLINGLCKADSVDTAGLLCKEMLIRSFCPNEVTYGSFLDYLSMGGNMEEALKLHKVMLEELLANTVTYNILIKGFCRSGRTKDANDLLVEMDSNGLSPDCVSYSTLIHEYCRMGDLWEAFKLWDIMLERGVKPDEVAYSLLIRGCCVNGDMKKAFELQDEMRKTINWDVCDSLISASVVST
ncbi:Pentatricopeptide repeat-containing protein [Acorus calamus]|uniref:Pentatricopeptide repeat-containing protein n=1 Tax=Acorus calamus TaxID=4465 RepID=A0AAV9CAY6_ACOCL|nr:Pentatricopeptide repeat-containing protein [Acorus calamus]